MAGIGRWGCWLALVVGLLAFAPLLWQPKLRPDLKGDVAVVTGGGRGIGRGIVVGLVEAGATVYVTGRERSSLDETCALVEGPGICVPKIVDNANDTSLEAFFTELAQETAGRLDILVNNAFAGAGYTLEHQVMGKAFWELPAAGMWDAVNHVGLRSHYIASVHAARIMAQRKSGLIVHVSSFGGIGYTFNVAYGVGKAAVDRMANDMAVELATEGVSVVSIWPGLVKTEAVGSGTLSKSGKLSERRGLPPGTPESFGNFEPLLKTPLAETPLFSGRAVASFARDVDRSAQSGTVLVPALMAPRYGFVDERGTRSPPMMSVKHFFVRFVTPVLEWAHVPDVPLGGVGAALSQSHHLVFNVLPDLAFPLTMAKMMSSSPFF